MQKLKVVLSKILEQAGHEDILNHRKYHIYSQTIHNVLGADDIQIISGHMTPCSWK